MLHGPQSSRRRFTFLPIFTLLAVVVAFTSCGQEATSGPSDLGQPLFKGKPGGGDIVVSSVDPPEAEQGVTLDVAVAGRNFPRGDVDSCTDPGQGCTWAELGIDEVVDEKVKTNRSTWVSSRRLIANITIDAEATPDLYDAIVSLRGSRGVGTEKFQVKVKPIHWEQVPLNVVIHDGLGLLRSDGQGSTDCDGIPGPEASCYADGEDSDGDEVEDVFAALPGAYFKIDLYESPRTYHVLLADGDIGGVCGTLDGEDVPIVCPPEGNMGYGRLTTIQDFEVTFPDLQPGETGEMGFAAIGMPTGRITWGKDCDNHPVLEHAVEVWAFDDSNPADGTVDRWTIEAISNSSPEGNALLCRAGGRARGTKGKPLPMLALPFNLPFKMTLCRQGADCNWSP